MCETEVVPGISVRYLNGTLTVRWRCIRSIDVVKNMFHIIDETLEIIIHQHNYNNNNNGYF